MKAQNIKASLPDTNPLVWRSLLLPRSADLEMTRDLLLIALGWEDDHDPAFMTDDGPIGTEDPAYYSAKLADYLRAPGDSLSFTQEAAGEWLVELELVDYPEVTADDQLPRLLAGEYPAPADDMTAEQYREEMMDRSPDINLAALNAEAEELFADTGADELAIAFTAGNLPADTTDEPLGEDVDADGEIPFEFDWMLAEHGIRLSDDNVRGLPQELIDFRKGLTEAQVSDPRRYRRLIEPLYKKYPNDPTLTLELAGVYAMTGEASKSRRLVRQLEKDHPDNLELLTSKLLSFDDDEDFMAEVAQLPQPLDIRSFPAGQGGAYHVTEFLQFEEVAIRAALFNNNVHEARQRLDRLVRFGFLHGDVEQPALATAGVMLFLEDAGEQLTQTSPVGERTEAILAVGKAEAVAMMKTYEAEQAAGTTVKRVGAKIGRNDPCPCGSGKKYKKCCL